MDKQKDIKLIFPPTALGFGGIVNGLANFEPFGTYPDRVPDRNEIPIQVEKDL